MKNWGFRKMGEAAEKWPKKENGDAVEPKFLMHLTGSQLDVDVAINMLKAYNIPIMATYPNDGEFGKLIIGLSGTGVDIHVPETMYEEAKALMDAEVEEPEEE